MYYIYILQCNDGKLYTGYSADLKRRITEHKNAEVFSTKNKLPVELIFYEAFADQADAKRREMYLKTTFGKRALKMMLKEYFKKSSY
ncbi:MAG: GIY-YIG nuclease family protein [Candidatus Andersenbacteria bacterium]